jgi:hypothetical protein
MIVPNMQTRFTGYRSDGTGNLLNAAMAKRQQDIGEDLGNAANELRRQQLEINRQANRDLDDFRRGTLANDRARIDALIENNRQAQLLARDKYNEGIRRYNDQAGFRDMLDDRSEDIRLDTNEYKRGIAAELIKKALTSDLEAGRQGERTKFIEGRMSTIGNQIRDLIGLGSYRRADLGAEFDRIAPKQRYVPNIEMLLGGSPNVSIDSFFPQSLFSTPQLDRRNLLGLATMMNMNTLGDF